MENTSEDKREQCIQISWVAMIPNLTAHLANIFETIHRIYNIQITHCSILPENSHHRSYAARNSNTTTIFIRARDDPHNQLKRLLNRYRFHEHGWETQSSAHVFTEADEVNCRSADCIECDNFNERTPYRNYNKYSCSNTIDITDHRISAQPTTPPKINQTINNIPASSSCNSTLACSICLAPTSIADSVKPLLHKNNTTACKHTICLTCLNALASFSTTSDHIWNGNPMISLKWRHKGAEQHVFTCPVCEQ
jgi:hypothetical protein